MNVNGYGFFKIYIALKMHFTSTYDIFKYNGKTKQSLPSLVGRRDETRFTFIANQLAGNKEEAGRFCLANFVYNTPDWLYQSIEQSLEVYARWKGIRASLVRQFEVDITTIERLCLTNGIKFEDIYEKTKSGKNPPLLQMITANLINWESAAILCNEYSDLVTRWNKLCAFDPLLDDTVFKMQKYKPFVTYNTDQRNKFRNILIEKGILNHGQEQSQAGA